MNVYGKMKANLRRINKLFFLPYEQKPLQAVQDTSHTVITQIGGENNVQNVKAGGKITLVGSQNNVQNVQAGDDIVIVSTQIGGKGNVQNIK